MVLIGTSCFHDGVSADNIHQWYHPCRERTGIDTQDPCPAKMEGPLYTLKYGSKRPCRQGLYLPVRVNSTTATGIKISVLVQVKVRHDCIIVSGERSLS